MTNNTGELLEGERIVFQTRLHWVLLLGPAVLIVFGGLSIPGRGWSALVLIATGFAWGILSYRKYFHSYIHVTNKRLLVCVSALVKRPLVIALTDISYVDFYRPSLGAMLNFGKITVVHGKNYKSIFRMVSAPVELVTAVREQIAVTPKSD